MIDIFSKQIKEEEEYTVITPLKEQVNVYDIEVFVDGNRCSVDLK